MDMYVYRHILSRTFTDNTHRTEFNKGYIRYTHTYSHALVETSSLYNWPMMLLHKLHIWNIKCSCDLLKKQFVKAWILFIIYFHTCMSLLRSKYFCFTDKLTLSNSLTYRLVYIYMYIHELLLYTGEFFPTNILYTNG